MINVEYMHYLGKIPVETAKKEMQDNSCRGSGVSPKDWEIRGLIETILAISNGTAYEDRLNTGHRLIQEKPECLLNEIISHAVTITLSLTTGFSCA